MLLLPREPTARDILAQYSAEAGTSTAQEVTSGVCVYLREALGRQLLCVQERPQFVAQLQEHGKARLCDVYGAEHLLRLFVVLPGLLAHTALAPDARKPLVAGLTAILAYMADHREQFFAGPDGYRAEELP